MKISICTSIFAERSIEKALKLSYKLGVGGVELWGREPHISEKTPLKRVKEIKNIADYYKLKIVNIGSYLGGFSTKSEHECSQELKKLEEFIERMELLSCEFIRVDCGGPNAFKAKEYHYDKSVYWMQKAADILDKYNKTILMEIHNGTLIETVKSALYFLEKVKRNNIALIHDAANMYITDTDYGKESVTILKDYILHVHIKDEIRINKLDLPGSFQDLTYHGMECFQQRLLGEGEVDHLPLLKALKDIEYKGFLSLESHAKEKDLVKAQHDLKELKRLLSLL